MLIKFNWNIFFFHVERTSLILETVPGAELIFLFSSGRTHRLLRQGNHGQKAGTGSYLAPDGKLIRPFRKSGEQDEALPFFSEDG